MANKLYDLAVKTGSYTNGQGELKNRYENIGSVMQGDNGQFIILKKTFNPAGVQTDPDKDSIIVSCFEPQQASNGQANQQNNPQQNAPQQQQQQSGHHNSYQQQSQQNYSQQRG